MNDMIQGDLFSSVLEHKQITKPIRLIECFAGIGSQFKALKQLTDKIVSYKIVEWSVNSFKAYNSIHLKDFNDYSKELTKEQLIVALRGVSMNYNEPMTNEQLSRKPLDWLKDTYNNVIATHNLINIMDVHGKDLEIIDTDKYEYILTYSFPCQDLSLAGLRKGMDISQADGGTRSGLLWEIERILDELVRERESLPQILVMENVPEVVGAKNIENFKKWELKLESLGYSNYVKVINAKDFGIPQNRRRCFMISILGEYAYDFPINMKLKYKLKDMLEDKVDEKFYISKKMIKYITADNEKWTGNNDKAIINKSIASTINTAEGQRRCDASNYVCDSLPEEYDLKFGNENLNDTLEKNKNVENGDFVDAYNKKVRKDGLANAILTGIDFRNQHFIAVNDKVIIPEATKKGYAEANNGDGVYINRPQQKRGVVQKGMIQTLKTNGDDVGVVNDLRIRKLTPKECYRLMGFQDCDYQACVDIGQSNATIYHQAGDSIVVTVLIALFSPLFSEPSNHKEIIKNYIERIKDERN